MIAAILVLALLPGVGFAQTPPTPAGSVSIDPYGLAHDRLTVDVEFCGHGELSGTPLGCGFNAGLAATIERHPRAAGSTASRHHVDAEGLIRLRSHGLGGWWIGMRTGLTYADRYGIRPSLGVDTGLSRVVVRRIYVGASVGAKKVFFLDDASDLRYNPSLRFAAGVAF